MAKRLRSLASLLWDAGDDDGCGQYANNKDAWEEEVQSLKEQLRSLREENMALKSKLSEPVTGQLQEQATASETFHAHCPWLDSLPANILQLECLHGEVLPSLLATNSCNAKVSFELCRSPEATASCEC